MLVCLHAFRSETHYEESSTTYTSPPGVLRTTYRCKHRHVESIRVVKVESICVSKRNFLLVMILVETILLENEDMVNRPCDPVEDSYLRQDHNGWHRPQ